MRNEQLKKTIKEMTLNELDNYVWKEYNSEKEPIEVTLTRPNSLYKIYQKQLNENAGWTNVTLGNSRIEINWQASAASIAVDNITTSALCFLKEEILNAPGYIEGYYFVDGEELDDFILNNLDDDIFNSWIANEDIRSSNKKISLEDFIQMYPRHRKLYEDMKSRYQTMHTVKMWEKLVENTEKRLSRPETESNINIEYYLKFESISDEAASLFNEYVEKMHSMSSVNAVSDKDMQDYTVLVIRNTLNDYIGVSYNVDKEAYNEIYKLREDEFENSRFTIFKDVKDKVVKHFEDLGFTLSDRNLSSIDWWVNNYKIRY